MFPMAYSTFVFEEQGVGKATVVSMIRGLGTWFLVRPASYRILLYLQHAISFIPPEHALDIDSRLRLNHKTDQT